VGDVVEARQRSPVDRDAIDPLGMGERELDRDDAAEALAEEVRTVDPQCTEQRRDAVGGDAPSAPRSDGRARRTGES